MNSVKLQGRKQPTTTIQEKKLAIYHCFENMQEPATFLKLKFVKFEFAVKLEFFEKIYFKFSKKISMNSSALKNFQNFFMVLDFIELEYPKSGRSLYIFKTVVNYNIICKKMIFGYFRPSYNFFFFSKFCKQGLLQKNCKQLLKKRKL